MNEFTFAIHALTLVVLTFFYLFSREYLETSRRSAAAATPLAQMISFLFTSLLRLAIIFLLIFTFLAGAVTTISCYTLEKFLQ